MNVISCKESQALVWANKCFSGKIQFSSYSYSRFLGPRHRLQGRAVRWRWSHLGREVGSIPAVGCPASTWLCPHTASSVSCTRPFCIRVILVLLQCFAVIWGEEGGPGTCWCIEKGKRWGSAWLFCEGFLCCRGQSGHPEPGGALCRRLAPETSPQQPGAWRSGQGERAIGMKSPPKSRRVHLVQRGWSDRLGDEAHLRASSQIISQGGSLLNVPCKVLAANLLVWNLETPLWRLLLACRAITAVRGAAAACQGRNQKCSRVQVATQTKTFTCSCFSPASGTAFLLSLSRKKCPRAGL